MVRVRFAPSPTGYLHIGNARTAILNYLFAKKQNGTFLLRIEDTDVERSNAIFTDFILSDLLWLGIKPDEGPYVQSERLEIYKEYAKKLIREGLAYKCYCSKERLTELREEYKKHKKPPRYDGRCRNLSHSEKERLESSGMPYVIRLLSPHKEIEFKDLIFGEIKFPPGYVDDFILIKADGMPSYNFAASIDDMLMGITHVIRGKDHIANTPKQILLFQALGKEHPQYAHHPLLLGKDGRPLSKREGSNEIKRLRELGILAEAIFNYLSVLGRKTDGEIMNMDEMVASFSIDSISRSDAIFDFEKLLWFNKQHMRRLTSHEIMRRAKVEVDSEIVEVLKDNIETLNDVKEMTSIFNNIEITEEGMDFLKSVKEADKIAEVLEESLNNFRLQLSSLILKLKEKGIPLSRDNMLALRVLVTGRKAGPPLDNVITFIPKDVILGRIEWYRKSL